MPLDLPPGDSCFIDANILYYHFVNTPPFSETCSDFLMRVSRQEVTGYTASHVVAEAIHKVMLTEASTRFGLERKALVNWVQNHRTRITELAEFRAAAREVRVMGLTLLPTDLDLLVSASDVASEIGLLTNDATIVALMRRHGLAHLATNDDDFDGVTGLTVWKPR